MIFWFAGPTRGSHLSGRPFVYFCDHGTKQSLGRSHCSSSFQPSTNSVDGDLDTASMPCNQTVPSGSLISNPLRLHLRGLVLSS